MANFTSLEKSVNYYDAVMRAWSIYIASLNINYTQIKYEDLLDYFDNSILRILEFLGLSWDDNVRIIGILPLVELINTPSSSQVIKHKSSVGRWRHYDKYFSAY